MALSTNDEARIREYLLGQLSAEERLNIEERLMIEDDLFEELEISKSELIEDYRSGDLSQTERESFEQLFLASLEGKQKYTFAIALRRHKEGDSPQPRPLPDPVPVGIISQRPHWANARLASLVVIIVVGISIPLYRSLQPPTVLSLELPITSNARDKGPQAPSVQLAGVDQLQLSLILPASAPPATGYRAKLLEENDTGEGRDIKVVGHGGGKVSVVIPKGELPPSEYAVKLFAVKEDGSALLIPGNYFFKVE